MARLDDLLRIDGVMAAGEFTADGTLVDYRANTNMPPRWPPCPRSFALPCP